MCMEERQSQGPAHTHTHMLTHPGIGGSSICLSLQPLWSPLHQILQLTLMAYIYTTIL